MSSWKLDPGQIEGILNEVEELRPALDRAVSDYRVERVFDYLAWGGGITVDVAAAVSNLLADQEARLRNIANRVDSGRIGVALASAAYGAGAHEMCETTQVEMLATAESGDFGYFQPFLEPPT